MRTKERQYYIKLLKRQMYPQRPWRGMFSYGKERHQQIAAMQSGVIGSFSGMTIVYATPPNTENKTNE